MQQRLYPKTPTGRRGKSPARESISFEDFFLLSSDLEKLLSSTLLVFKSSDLLLFNLQLDSSLLEITPGILAKRPRSDNQWAAKNTCTRGGIVLLVFIGRAEHMAMLCCLCLGFYLHIGTILRINDVCRVFYFIIIYLLSMQIDKVILDYL